ncbi:MAG: hypothetical protein A2X84_01225 [Desulfuromonadaceae bacterium GWC2_58_13]|nr:MAG: hypothetical protein A2X84_01225 [Desulfuromonadaceae bacterium GWC2_58_13]
MKSFLVLTILLSSALAGPAVACFGPKLYLGVPEGTREAAVAAVAILYIQEKTGVETIQVSVPAGRGVAGVLEESLDMILAPSPVADLPTLLKVPGGPFLLSGRRPLDDLQFTTVAPALQNLDHLLTTEFIERLMALVEVGTPAAAARQLMMELRWI